MSGDPTVTLAEGMGTLRGKEKKTVGNLGANPRTYYRFSNIKYANMVSEENRFKVLRRIKIVGWLSQDHKN